MRWIYLSPHLDDAVLSAGGLIYEQTQSGIPVEIWTCMCGFPPDLPESEYSSFAQSLHREWGFSSAVEGIRLRRQEDQSAASQIGASVLHFDFLDCIYRRGTNGGWLYDAIALPPREEDTDLPSQIAAVVTTRLMPDDVLVCQLSVGSHVDHVLVREAAELLSRPLLYDVDIPYLFDKPHELEPKAAGMTESVRSVTEAGLRAWQGAILEYKSQLPVLGDTFNTPEKAEQAIQAYWAQRKGIPLWKVT
ncbi:MAG TPA: PIG-L family deacetylase [Anaerolineales bacterium]|nr:PIG-L family deacetylase [Anaerolineales bacterium]